MVTHVFDRFPPVEAVPDEDVILVCEVGVRGGLVALLLVPPGVGVDDLSRREDFGVDAGAALAI